MGEVVHLPLIRKIHVEAEFVFVDFRDEEFFFFKGGRDNVQCLVEHRSACCPDLEYAFEVVGLLFLAGRTDLWKEGEFDVCGLSGNCQGHLFFASEGKVNGYFFLGQWSKDCCEFFRLPSVLVEDAAAGAHEERDFLDWIVALAA